MLSENNFVKSRGSTPSKDYIPTKQAAFLEQHNYLTRFVNKRHLFKENKSKEEGPLQKSANENQTGKSRSSTPIDRQTTIEFALKPDFSRFYENTN